MLRFGFFVFTLCAFFLSAYSQFQAMNANYEAANQATPCTSLAEIQTTTPVASPSIFELSACRVVYLTSIVCSKATDTPPFGILAAEIASFTNTANTTAESECTGGAVKPQDRSLMALILLAAFMVCFL